MVPLTVIVIVLHLLSLYQNEHTTSPQVRQPLKRKKAFRAAACTQARLNRRAARAIETAWAPREGSAPPRCPVGLRGDVRQAFQGTPPRSTIPEAESNNFASPGTGKDCATVMEPFGWPPAARH